MKSVWSCISCLHVPRRLSFICFQTHQHIDWFVRAACAMASHCVMETKLVVTNDFKSNWVPETQDVDNATFMRLCKWDRCFVMFCTGKALQFSGGPRQDVNVGFFEKLQRIRTTAVNAAVAAVLEADTEDGAKKRKRTRKARLSDRVLVPPIINIMGPALHDATGLVHEALPMRVLFGIKNHDLWIEATPQNLEYMRHGVLSAMSAAQTGRKWRQKPNSDEDDGRSAEIDSPRESDAKDDELDAAQR